MSTTKLYKLTSNACKKCQPICEMEVDCEAEKGSMGTTVLYKLMCNMCKK